MRRLLVPGVALLLALSVAGCGGKDDATAHDSGDATSTSAATAASVSTPPGPSPDGAAPQVTQGISPDDLMGCLTTAGLQATVDDAVPMGVTDPEQTIVVDQMQGYDGTPSQAAYLYVFADPASAQKNAAVVTLGGTDDPTNNRFAVSGNVVREFNIITGAKPTTDEANLLSCIPG